MGCGNSVCTVTGTGCQGFGLGQEEVFLPFPRASHVLWDQTSPGVKWPNLMMTTRIFIYFKYTELHVSETPSGCGILGQPLHNKGLGISILLAPPRVGWGFSREDQGRGTTLGPIIICSSSSKSVSKLRFISPREIQN